MLALKIHIKNEQTYTQACIQNRYNKIQVEKPEKYIK